MYVLAFEIAPSGLGGLVFVLPGILFICIGIVLIITRKSLYKSRDKSLVILFISFWLLFAFLWTLIAGIGIGVQQAALRQEYLDGHFKVVEGLVKDFDPMPSSGHKMESFRVNGVKFEYSDYVITPGFNNTTSHGGPIVEGLPVRVSYINQTIVKLEIAAKPIDRKK
jgi:hypothetical protein